MNKLPQKLLQDILNVQANLSFLSRLSKVHCSEWITSSLTCNKKIIDDIRTKYPQNQFLKEWAETNLKFIEQNFEKL